MAFDETFKHRIDIDEEQAFGLFGQAKTFRELQPSHFDGKVAEWAEERAEKFGDKIVPRHVYMETVERKAHRVAWVYHEGINFESGEEFQEHHIICDCVLEAEHDGEEHRIFGCEGMMGVLYRRAAFVNHIYKIDPILTALQNPDRGDFDQPSSYHDFSLRTIGMVLEHDLHHPESWPANLVDGMHHASLMAVILQQPPDVVKWYCELLQESGYIEFDGENFRLSEDEREKILEAKEAA